jgi:hypothetical protein
VSWSTWFWLGGLGIGSGGIPDRLDPSGGRAVVAGVLGTQFDQQLALLPPGRPYGELRGWLHGFWYGWGRRYYAVASETRC